MKLGFEETQAAYVSPTQNARAWTERWVGAWLYCPNCGNPKLDQFAANRPVADFFCASCAEEYELKSQKRGFGQKVVDGAFSAMSQRLAASNNPSLLLLHYDLSRLSVANVVIVPKHFFVQEIIERRKPLRETARRRGWIGCNILLNRIPAAGKIYLVKDGQPRPKELVLTEWKRTSFLRDERGAARGWLIETMKCVEEIGRDEFGLEEVYQFEPRLATLYPNNRHVKQKIRQQLQVLRDHGFLEFVSRGYYRLRRTA